eukprot:m.40666 g.40666  ORF g.40666 m.40666 type:complete len:311 (+) comp18569_c0_seq1:170-1102(+)
MENLAHQIGLTPVAPEYVTHAKHILDQAEECVEKGEFDRAVECFQQAAHVYERANDVLEACLTYRSLSRLYLSNGNHLQAAEAYQYGFELTQPMMGADQLMGGYTNIMNMYADAEEYERAEPWLLNTLKLEEEAAPKDLPSRAVARKCVNVSQFYGNALEDNDKAIVFLFRARGIYEQLNDEKGQLKCWKELSEIYMDMHDNPNTIIAFKECVRIAENQASQDMDRNSLASALVYLGNFSFEGKRWEEARGYFQRSVSYREVLLGKDNLDKPNKLMSDAYYWLALALAKLGRTDEAKAFETKSSACLPEK